MMNSTTIYKATEDDFEAILPVFQAAIEPEENYVFTKNASRDDIFAYWFAPGITSYVIEVDRKIAGIAKITPNYRELGSHVANLCMVIVYNTYNTNILGCHRMARAVLPYMRERNDGLIIQISSGGGRLTFPLLGAYCSSKFTLESLSDAMRYELAPMGIDVVVIQPDDTESEILNNGRRYVEEIMKTISSDRQRLDAYKEHLKLMDYALSAEDVPVAAEVVATEIVKSASTQKGQRPNRVCLSGQLVVDINTLMQNAQKEVISGTPYAPWQTLKV